MKISTYVYFKPHDSKLCVKKVSRETASIYLSTYKDIDIDICNLYIYTIYINIFVYNISYISSFIGEFAAICTLYYSKGTSKINTLSFQVGKLEKERHHDLMQRRKSKNNNGVKQLLERYKLLKFTQVK